MDVTLDCEKSRFTVKRLLGALLAIVVLVVSQVTALGIGSLVVMIGMPGAVGNVIAGIIYGGVTLFGLTLLCKKVLRISPVECGIGRPGLKLVWGAAAFLMPLLVIGSLFLTSGTWINSWEKEGMDLSEIITTLTGSVCYFGFATGIVEEAVFRGVIMTALERRWNRIVAILVPSMLFGLLHVIGNDLDFISILQLFVAGTFVGVLFSLVTYESGSIWCSSFMHGIWNIFMCTGTLNIGTEYAPDSIFNYVLDTKSFLITGGDFGIEASVISVLVYILFSVLALILIKRNRNRNTVLNTR